MYSDVFRKHPENKEPATKADSAVDYPMEHQLGGEDNPLKVAGAACCSRLAARRSFASDRLARMRKLTLDAEVQ